MFYSKYSDYLPEQIISENYEKICDLLLKLSDDEKIKQQTIRNTL